MDGAPDKTIQPTLLPTWRFRAKANEKSLDNFIRRIAEATPENSDRDDHESTNKSPFIT